MRAVLTITALAVLGTMVPMHAKASDNTDSLAKQCQALALKAHPASLPNTPAVSNLRHSYYTLCMDRQAKMDQELANAR
jgi:hypothetical protein